MDLVTLGLGVDGRGAIQTLNQFTGSAHNAGTAGGRLENTTRRLTRALGGLGAFFSVRQMIQYADTWTLIGARIDLVSESTEQTMAVQQKLFEISQRTRNSMGATSVLYTRLAINADQLGRSHQDLLDVTEAVNSAMLLSGATGVEAAQGMRQLAQALGSGRVQGDEFRTMMEAMPLVARSIADAMGVPLGELYKLSKQGKITVDVVVDALLSRHAELVAAAEDMPWTISQSMTYLSNAAERMVGIVNSASGVTGNLSGWIRKAADNMDKLFAAVGAAAGAFITYQVAVRIAHMYTMLMTATQTIAAFISLARSVRSVADAMALLSLVGGGTVKVIAAIAAATIGFIAYKTILTQIEQETEKWERAQADLNDTLGERPPGSMSEADLKRMKTAREEMEDMIRLARQQIEQARVEGAVLANLELRHDAINKAIEARRDLAGLPQSLIDEMEATILQEEELLRQAGQIEREMEAIREFAEEQQRILSNYSDELQRTFANTFTKIFKDGLSSFSDLFDAIKILFFRLLAEMLSAQMMKQVGNRFAAALMGIFGGAKKVSEQPGNIPIVIGPNGEWLPGPTEDIVVSPGQTAFGRGVRYAGAAVAGYGAGQMFSNAGLGAGASAVGGALSGAAMGFAVGGPIGAAVGALSGAISGFIGVSDREREERARNREILRANNERLQELRDVIEGTTMASRLTGGLEAMQRVQEALEGADSVQALINAFGETAADRAMIRRLADELGIDLGAPGVLEQFVEAVELSIQALTQFGRNLDDITARIEAYNTLFDVDMSPQQALEDTFTILNEMAPELMRELGLTNLDLGTEAGRATLLAGLQEIYNMIVSGELTPDLLGAFSDKNQLLGAVIRVKEAMDKLAEVVFDIVTDFPRAMDIVYYEQLYGRYNDTGYGDTLPYEPPSQEPNEPPPQPNWQDLLDANPGILQSGFVVQGDVVIQTEEGEDGEVVLDRIIAAARRRTLLGGWVSLGSQDRESF